MKSKPYLIALALLFAIPATPVFSLAGDDPAPAVSQSAPARSVMDVAAPDAPAVPVAEPAAPPEWAQKIMVVAQNLPVVGPIISKALMVLGIVAAVTTSIVGVLLSLLNIITGVFHFAGAAGIAQALSDFKNGKIMYWIKFFSLFNAKKPEEKK